MPLKGDVRVDKELTNLTLALFQDDSSFIAPKIAPEIPVDKSSGVYYVFPDDMFMRTFDDSRAPATPFKQIDYDLTTAAFATVEHGLEHPIDEKVRDNADSVLDLRRQGNQITGQAVKLNWEKEIADLLTTAANYPTGHKTTLSGTDQWSDFQGSDPIGDIKTAILQIQTATGKRPNKIAFGLEVWNKVSQHPDLLGRVSNRDTQDLSRDDVARLFEVEEILVGEAIRNTANQGATISNAFLWGKHVVIGFVDPSPGMMVASLAYQFVWQQGRTVTYPNTIIKSDVIRVERDSVGKVVAGKCGYLYTNAVA